MGGAGDVTLPQDLPGRANMKSEQSVVRLSEVGWWTCSQLVSDRSNFFTAWSPAVSGGSEDRGGVVWWGSLVSCIW